MIKEILRNAGTELKKHYYSINNSETKERFHLVTESDLIIEKLIIDELKNHYKDYSIYSEEIGSIAGDKNFRWIIDPIDGTADFVFGVPYFAISICLEIDNKISEGYVYNPISEEMYYSISGEGKSYLNNKEITVSETIDISDSLIAFGFSANYSNIERYYTEWKPVFENCKKGMPLIAPALSICNVARGRIEGFIDFGSSMEGHSAAALILKNASGQVYNYDFSEWDHKKKGILATNGKINLKGF